MSMVMEWYPLLLGAAAKSAVVIGAAWLTAWLLRRRSAAARHLVWTAASAALLALPFLSASLPALRVKSAALSALEPNVFFYSDSIRSGDSTAKREASGAPANAATARNLQTWMALIWAAGAALVFAGMIAGWVRISRLRRAARTLEVMDGVPVLETPDGTMPMAVGFWKPAVLLPADAACWCEERRRMVLLHELAHVRRGDVATQTIARIALCLHWWNPLAWMAWKEFLRERERAADDLVLNAGAGASDYAGHLLDVARSMRSAPASSAGVAMARRSQLEGRLLAILDSGTDRRSFRRAAPIVAGLLAIALVAPFAAMRAQDATAKTPAQQEAGKLLNKAADAAALGNRQEAIDLYNRAIAVGDRSQIVSATLSLALLRQAEGTIPEADSLFLKALAAAAPESSDAAGAMEIYAQFLVSQGRSADAASIQARAAAIRQARIAEMTTPDDPSINNAQRISEGITRPEVRTKVEPEYSFSARALKISGTAILTIVIGTDGLAHNFHVKRAVGYGLDEKAIEAIRQWRFQPATRNDVPTPVAAQIEVNFKLK